MDVGLGVIGFLLIGLPLVAYGFARRLPPPRRRATPPDAFRELTNRHRLSATDVWRVQQAVAEGVATEDPRLRAAAVDYARVLLAPRSGSEAKLRRHPLLRAVLIGAYVLLAVAAAVHGPGALFGLVGLVGPAFRWQQKRAARRAVDANSATGTEGLEGGIAGQPQNHEEATDLPPSLG